MKNKKLKTKKIIAVSQVISMILEIFAFSFIIGGMAFGATITSVPEVSAGLIPSGCCIETKDGGICQELNNVDKGYCKTALLTTSCNNIDECETGCCYNPNGGECSLNAPKGKCIESGGNWSKNPMCDIQQCVVGCCVLGNNAEQTTARECAKISRETEISTNFQTLDSDGSCSSKINLDRKGACVIPTSDFSGENDCKFVTKYQCQQTGGEFYQDYLCTTKSFKTNCFKSQNTTCVEDADQVYYVDTCGNQANIYDANKYDDDDYWEKILEPSESCADGNENADCGNCDYMSGSICQDYRKGKDTKPIIGNKICRNLNCLNGRKHGESWCISDYPFSGDNILAVGSRYFRGICLDGEISVEQCADFNQEICLELTSDDFTKAKCVVNEWRSCLAANDETSYDSIKNKCDSNSQCMMFNEYYGELSSENDSSNSTVSNSSKLGRSDGTILAGFNPELEPSEQGASGVVGNSSNEIISHCVPKYAPGFVFWQDSENNVTNNYGGSYTESSYICSIGSFTCVSKKQRDCALASGFLSQTLCMSTVGISSLVGDPDCEDWRDIDNWECNIDGEHRSVNQTELPKLMNALNERCRAIGSCGINSNIAGEKVIENSSGFTIKRIKYTAEGDTINLSTANYKPSEEYLGSLPGAIEKIPSLTDLIKKEALQLAGFRSDKTSETTHGTTTGFDNAESSAKTQFENEMQASEALGMTALSNVGMYSGAASLIAWGLGGFSVPFVYSGASWGLTANPAGVTAIGASIGAIAGYALGRAIVKNQHWSSGRVGEFMEAIVANAAMIGAAIGFALAVYAFATSVAVTVMTAAGVGTMSAMLTVAASAGTVPVIGWIVAIIVVIATIIYNIYESCFSNDYKENAYYIMQFSCGTWQAPDGGDSCDLCNNDVRPCSEYRCRSLGENCQYSNANGEPGICTNGLDWTGATITPWPDGLSEGLKYESVAATSFSIEKNDSSIVDAYTTVEFGVQTDKPAQCRIDNKHTTSFDEMAVQMNVDASLGCQTGNCGNQGNYHIIALSPYIPESERGSATLGLKQGENQFYIRCQTYAGGSNKAEFTVNVKVGEGPDRTPPNIKSFNPVSRTYFKQGTNSSLIIAYVDEPAECKYSQEAESSFEEMNKTFSCSTNAEAAILGKWPCYAQLTNLTSGNNKIYIQCKDHPELIGRSELTRNLNKKSKEYDLKICSTGLNITKISPSEQIITGKSPISAKIEVETSGCIDGGKAICEYKLDGMTAGINFLKTNSKQHTQTFTSLPNGEHNLTITCSDEAGNSDSKTVLIDVELDNQAPIVLKSYYVDNRKLVVLTDEESTCKYTTNSSKGCFFDFDLDNSTIMTGDERYHEGYWKYTENYYIKCRDQYNNTNLNCGIELRTY